MRAIGVLCLAILLGSSSCLPIKLSAKDCGASGGHYQSFDLAPSKPRTGEVFKVTNRFSFNDDVSGGDFAVKVTALGGIPLKHQTGPLCGTDTTYDVHLAVVKVATVTIYGSTCPMAKGPNDISYSIKLLSILPPALGDASFHLTAKDQKGTDILCVQAHLGIQVENNAKAATADGFMKALTMLSPPAGTAEVAFTTTWPANPDKNPFSKWCVETHKDLPVYGYFTALFSALALRWGAKPVISHNTTCPKLGFTQDYHTLCEKDAQCEKYMERFSSFDVQLWVAPKHSAEAMSGALALLMAESAEPPASAAPAGISLTHSDCGGTSSHAPIVDFGPSAVALGQKTTMVGHGKLDEIVASATFELTMTGALGTMLHCTGDASQTKSCPLPMGFGSLTMQGMSFPLQPGSVPVNVDIYLKETTPKDLLTTTTVAKATDEHGEEIFCIKIESAPTAVGTADVVV